MLNEQLTCAVPLNCIEHAGIAGLTKTRRASNIKAQGKRLRQGAAQPWVRWNIIGSHRGDA